MSGALVRRHAAIGALVTIAIGLVSRRVPIGFSLWDKSLGDALYTVMVYFFVALLRPMWRPHVLGLVSLAISIMVEIFQLTGIPSKLPRILQIALGTTFAWHDIACYVVGACAIAMAHHFAVRSRPPIIG